MELAKPKIVVIDSATLGKVSRDYWNDDDFLRKKARTFITRLQNLGVFITFTATHIIELLRYKNEHVLQERLMFLRSIPFIAWLRPYDRSWLPGSIADLFLRELHVVLRNSTRNWRSIINEVRPDLWETGIGSEIFVEDSELWINIKRGALLLHEKEKYTVSMARTDAGNIKNMKVSEFLSLPLRTKDSRDSYGNQFAQELNKQLCKHGDKRLNYKQKVAIDFVNETLQDVKSVDELGGDLIQNLLECCSVPNQFISPDMTLEEFGELAVYAERLKLASRDLRPSVEFTISDVPPDTLPSYVLQRKLVSIQRKAERVSGSDMGDSYIAPLLLYTDGVEVDKRTCEFLKQLSRKQPKLSTLMGRFFTTPDYSRIPELFDYNLGNPNSFSY